MGRPRIYTDEQRREKRRLKQAKWRERNLERSREIVRESERRRAALRAISEGREPGVVGRPKKMTPEEKRAKRKAKTEAYNAAHIGEVREKARLRGQAKRDGTFVSRALPRLTEEQQKLVQRAMSANRRARVRGNGGKHTMADIIALHDKQNGICAFCKNPLNDGTDIHVDHWVPIVLGGSNDPGNLRLLHSVCNLIKGARHPDEFEAALGPPN